MDLNWRKITNTSGEYGCMRQGHTITYIKHLDSMLLYGGAPNPRLNAVYLYSIKNNSWTLQPTEGRKPNSRSYHTAMYDQHLQLYLVYGGQAEKGRSLDDFHILSLRNWQWKKLFLMQFPPPRHSHTMTDMKNQERSRIIFGGLSLPANQLLNDVWIFKNLSNAQSNSTVQELHGCTCDIQYTKGEVPPGRRGHQSQVYGKNLFVFGGESKDKNQIFTIYCLSLDNFTWKKIEPKGKTIPQRSQFTSILYSTDVLIYGGIEPEIKNVFSQLYKFNVTNMKLEEVKMKNIPLGRFDHSMTITSSSQLDIFKAFMVGGKDSSFRPFDLYQLSQGRLEQTDKSSKKAVAAKDLKDYNEQIEELDVRIIRQKQQKMRLQKQIKQREKLQAQQPPPQSKSSQALIELLLTMIKNEQFLSQQILKKNNILQNLLRRIQQYVYVLNQNYNNYGEQDDEIDRIKQNHIGVCLKLKQTYQHIDKYYKKNLNLISSSRSEVISYNNEFQGLMETEVDEDL